MGKLQGRQRFAWVRAVLFDLDGTLTDTFELWYQAVAELARRHGRPRLDREQYRRRWWGMDGRSKVREILGARDDEVEALYGELVELLMEHVGAVRLLAGAREAVEALAPVVPLAAISNGPQCFLDAQLHRVGLDGFFAARIADAEPKPNPGGILRACAAIGVAPREALFVGDSRFDEAAARNAGARWLILADDVRRDVALRPVIDGLSSRTAAERS